MTDELDDTEPTTPEEEAPVPSEKPWRRMSGEPTLWYTRFQTFYRLGVRRSMLGCYNRLRAQEGKSEVIQLPNNWRRQTQRWRWRERAEAYDHYHAQRDELKWQKRRDQHREQEWGVTQELLEKAKRMIAWPLERVEREADQEGRTVKTIVNPTRWTIRDAAQMLEVASKIARLSAEMKADAGDVDWRAELLRMGLDPGELLNLILAKLEAKDSRRSDARGDENTPRQSDAPGETQTPGPA